MTEHPYMEPVASRPEDQDATLSLADPSGPSPSPVRSTYSHLSYTETAVPSFAYPSSSEPILLTPSSLAGSPPVHQTAKLIHNYNYNSPPMSLSPQQPTPPATSTMQWPTQFHLAPAPGGRATPADPENPPTSATQSHFDSAFMGTDNTTDGVPEAPELYFGHYGVSENCKIEVDEQMQYYDMSNTGPPPPLLMEQHPGQQMQQSQEMTTRTPLPQDSSLLLPAGSPTLFQQPGNLDVTQVVKYTRGSPYHAASHEGSTGARERPGRVNKMTKKRRRVQKNQGVDASRGSPEEAVQLKPGISEDDRFLIELRIRHRGAKGKTMWEDMKADYEKAYKKRPEKAALQMRLTRAKSKFVQWPKRNEDLLQEAYDEDEKERYDRIHARYLEKGGGSIIDFNAKNIECKLVEMGLEGMYVDPDTGIRQRTRVTGNGNGNGQRRSTEKAENQASQQGVHLAQPYQGMGAFTLTEDQKETLYAQVERRGMVDDDEDCPAKNAGEGEADVQIKEEPQQGMRVFQQVPTSLQNGHIGHFQVGPGNGGGL